MIIFTVCHSKNLVVTDDLIRQYQLLFKIIMEIMYSKLLVGLIKILGGYNHIVYQIFIGGQEAMSYINIQCRQVTAQILVGISGGKCGAAALLNFRVFYIIYCLVSYVCVHVHIFAA